MGEEEGLTRRSALKAAAWSAPIIAVAAFAPIVAASTGTIFAGDPFFDGVYLSLDAQFVPSAAHIDAAIATVDGHTASFVDAERLTSEADAYRITFSLDEEISSSPVNVVLSMSGYSPWSDSVANSGHGP